MVLVGTDGCAHPRFGTGDPIGQAFVGLGRFVRMCIIPNELPPGIPPGGLFGPEAPIPWGRFPGYTPPPDIMPMPLPKSPWRMGLPGLPGFRGDIHTMPAVIPPIWDKLDELMSMDDPEELRDTPGCRTQTSTSDEMADSIAAGIERELGHPIERRSLTAGFGSGSNDSGYYVFKAVPMGNGLYRPLMAISVAGAQHQQGVNQRAQERASRNRAATAGMTEAEKQHLAEERADAAYARRVEQSAEDFEASWQANRFGKYPWLEFAEVYGNILIQVGLIGLSFATGGGIGLSIEVVGERELLLSRHALIAMDEYGIAEEEIEWILARGARYYDTLKKDLIIIGRSQYRNRYGLPINTRTSRLKNVLGESELPHSGRLRKYTGKWWNYFVKWWKWRQ